VPEERRVFSELTVAENMFIAVPNGSDAGAEMDRMYDLFPDLEKRQSAKASNLSGGQQQMLAIARALVGDNDLLLLDEPSEGLAPQIVETVADAIRTIRDDVTILLVEQNLPLAMDLSDRFYLLDHGRVVHEGESRLGISEDETIRRRLSA
jgi:branched-chain amino acid transport system ATP-binding protein